MVNQISVRLISHTVNPAETVAVAGKGCYSARPACDIALTPEGIDHTLDVIHPSCYEHAVFTFSISGISRVTSHQLVRHRMASYSQQSQRYVRQNSWEVIIPETVKKLLDKEMENTHVTSLADYPLNELFEDYQKALKALVKTLSDKGIPSEDVRYLMPQGVTTSIVVTMNARELQHFCGLRRCTRAQWEIRELADKMAQAAEEACPELFKHFSLGPQCEQLGYCPEHKGCGKKLPLYTPLRYEKGVITLPEYTPEQIEEMKNKIMAAMESTNAVPIVELPTDTTSTYVPGRIAGEMLAAWPDDKIYTVQKGKGIIGEVRKTEVTDKTRTAEEYREDGYEDLAQQKEREEDAVNVAKSVVEKSVPCCPNCGTPLATELRMMDSDLRRMVGDSEYTIGCPHCQVWSSSPLSAEVALKKFIESWDIVDEGDEE